VILIALAVVFAVVAVLSAIKGRRLLAAAPGRAGAPPPNFPADI